MYRLAAFSLLPITLLFYLVAKKLYSKHASIFFSPLLMTPLLIGALLLIAGIPYATYAKQANWLGDLLGPATVAFAIPMHKNYRILQKHAGAIMIGVISGSAAAITTTIGMAWLFRLSPRLLASLVGHSVSIPFALPITARIGGLPALTSLSVVITALLGTAFGSFFIRYLPINTQLARGAMLGLGAQAAGTAKAQELGPEAVTVSSLVMIIAGILTLIVLPAVFPGFA